MEHGLIPNRSFSFSICDLLDIIIHPILTHMSMQNNTFCLLFHPIFLHSENKEPSLSARDIV